MTAYIIGTCILTRIHTCIYTCNICNYVSSHSCGSTYVCMYIHMYVCKIMSTYVHMYVSQFGTAYNLWILYQGLFSDRMSYNCLEPTSKLVCMAYTHIQINHGLQTHMHSDSMQVGCEYSHNTQESTAHVCRKHKRRVQ